MIMIKKTTVQARVARTFSQIAAFPVIVALLLVAGCAQQPVRPTPVTSTASQDEREAGLSKIDAWSFDGRLAISQAGQGGNARVQWRQQGEDFDIRLSAPITGQSWHLRRQQGQATLEGMEGGPRQGEDAERLLLDATGWQIPLAAMTDWVRGARADGPSELSLDAHGLPAALVQGGWTVEFHGWTPDDPALPEKIFARKAQASVRLVVERWNAQ